VPVADRTPRDAAELLAPASAALSWFSSFFFLLSCLHLIYFVAPRVQRIFTGSACQGAFSLYKFVSSSTYWVDILRG
jgi:hypothetical protein